MVLIDNDDMEEFLLFVRDFNMTLAVSKMMATDTKMQYLCTIVCVETLHQFD